MKWHILPLLIFVTYTANGMIRFANEMNIFILPAPKKQTVVAKSESSPIPIESRWKPTLDFTVNPKTIKSIRAEPVPFPEGIAQGYNAILYNGNEVTCFLILEGKYKGEKWALLYVATEEEEEPFPTPIPAENFDILERYNQTNKINVNKQKKDFS